MLINTLSKNKVILTDKQLEKLGFKKEEPASMDHGTYITHVVGKNGSFLEITNEYNEEGKFFNQFLDIRIVRQGNRKYTAFVLELIIKIFF